MSTKTVSVITAITSEQFHQITTFSSRKKTVILRENCEDRAVYTFDLETGSIVHVAGMEVSNKRLTQIRHDIHDHHRPHGSRGEISFEVASDEVRLLGVLGRMNVQIQ